MNHAGAQSIFAHHRPVAPAHRRPGPLGGLHVLIAGSLAAACAVAGLGAAFSYGAGYLQRPVLAVVTILLAAGLLWWFAVRTLDAAGAAQGPGTASVLVVTVLLALPHLWAGPILENDFYRYLLYGASVACGQNPYLRTPAQWQDEEGANCLSAGPPAAATRPRGTADPRWAAVLSRVSFPELRTIYPPLAELWFGAVVWVAGPSLFALRVSFLLAVVAATLALARLLRRLGEPPALAAVFAWSPLVWKELINSAHYDALAVLALTCAALAWASERRRLAFALLGACAALKLFAWLLLPLWLRNIERRERATALLAFASVAVLAYVPFAAAGTRLFETTLRFAADWQANAPLFTPAVLALQRSRALQPVGLGAAGAQAVIGSLVLGVLAFMAFRPLPLAEPSDRGGAKARALFHRSLWMLTVLLVCGPVANPWYFCWLLPLIALEPARHWAALIIMLPLYYLEFYFSYRGLQGWIPVVTGIEYAPFLVLAALATAYRNKSSSGGRTIERAPRSSAPSGTE